jgi:hypothetical protein
MVGVTYQSWVALAMVAAAIVYLLRLAVRRGRDGCDDGCCGASCSSASHVMDEPPSIAEPRSPEMKSFVPLENFTDMARREGERRRIEREDSADSKIIQP